MTSFRFFVFNLVGNILPMLIALVAVPVIAHFAGVERLGALGVVWALVGYFGFLDFGLSRVVTRRVAHAVEQGRVADELAELRSFLYWWAVPALIAIALVFLAARGLLMQYFANGVLVNEVADGWSLIAWCIPVTLATNWLRGALEGLQRFARVNALRTVFGTWTFAAPAVVTLYHPTMDAMIAAIVLGRVLALLGHVWACWQVEKRIMFGSAPLRPGSVRLFFQEGGWITVSNLVSPLMVYFDRFFLAALVSVRAVAWYATAHEVMLRTLLVPSSLAGVMFPKFAGVSGTVPGAQVVDLYQRGIRVAAALMLPVCILGATGAYDAMHLWMGEEFALNSYRVVQIIAVGIFGNSIAQLPFAWLQGVGRSDLTARAHLFELPLYAAGLYVAVLNWGIVGAAWMWTFRVSLDCVLLLKLARQRGANDTIVTVFCGAAVIAVTGFLTGPAWAWQWRAAICFCMVAGALIAAWFGLLNKKDRVDMLRLRYAY